MNTVPIYALCWATDAPWVRLVGAVPVVAIYDEPDLVLLADVVCAHEALPDCARLALDLDLPLAKSVAELRGHVEAMRAQVRWAIVATCGEATAAVECDEDDEGFGVLAALYDEGARGAWALYRIGWFADPEDQYSEEPWVAWSAMTDTERARWLLREGTFC